MLDQGNRRDARGECRVGKERTATGPQTLKGHLPDRGEEWVPSSDPTEEERALLRRYVDAHERADHAALAGLLRDDVRVTIPPHSMWFVGRESYAAFMAQVFDPGSRWYHGRWRLVATRANRRPAMACYVTAWDVGERWSNE